MLRRQLCLLYLINKEMIGWSRFAGKMYLCDFGALIIAITMIMIIVMIVILVIVMIIMIVVMMIMII